MKSFFVLLLSMELMSLYEQICEFRRFYSVNNSSVKFDYTKYSFTVSNSIVKEYLIYVNDELKPLLEHQEEMLKNLLIILDKRVYNDINFVGYNKDNFMSSLDMKDIYYTLMTPIEFNGQFCNICIYKCKRTNVIKIFYINLTTGRILQIIRKLADKCDSIQECIDNDSTSTSTSTSASISTSTSASISTLASTSHISKKQKVI